MPRPTLNASLLFAASLMTASAAGAADPARPQITISDHRFTPAELHVPANQPLVIDVHNQDPTAEEFESADMGVEKVIAGGRALPVRIRPLAPGRYTFIGEYHAETATGVIIADGEK
ncbi:MAG: cupredoxin domain-containing protein [Janthinobacterium lividum]